MLLKTYEQYLHYKNLNDYKARAILEQTTPKNGIEGILDQESASLIDKLNITASQITDRLRLNYEHYGLMIYHYLNIRNSIHELSPQRSYNQKDSTRRISALEGQIVSISKDIIEEKIRCWEQLIAPMNTFLDAWEKYQEQKMEKKMIGDTE